MSRLLSILFLFAAFETCMIAAPTKILFAGNSQTISGGSTKAFTNLATSLGKSVYVREFALEGAGLPTYVVHPDFLALLRSEVWDYVVLQPSLGAQSSGVDKAIALALRDSIYKYSGCDAHVLFYELPRSPSGYGPDALERFNIQQDDILRNTRKISEETDLYFAPAGEAVRSVYNRDLAPFFWISDKDLHLNGIGGYAAACVFYATIFLQPCTGAPFVGYVDPNVAHKLQVAADETVLTDPTQWRIGITTQPVTDFSYVHSNYYFEFTNLSNSHEPIMWDFGNGQTSDRDNPKLMLDFNEQSSYTITLHTRIRCLTDEKAMVIHKEDLTNFHFVAAPNPTTGSLTITQEMYDPNAILRIYDLTGSLVKEMQLTQQVQTLSIEGENAGIYFLKLYSGNQVFLKVLQVLP